MEPILTTYANFKTISARHTDQIFWTRYPAGQYECYYHVVGQMLVTYIDDPTDIADFEANLKVDQNEMVDGSNCRARALSPAATALTALTGWQTRQVSVGITAVQVDDTPISERKTVSLKASCSVDSNGNSDTIYVGPEGVTAATGYALRDKETVDLDLKESASIWAVSDATRNPSNKLYVVEMS